MPFKSPEQLGRQTSEVSKSVGQEVVPPSIPEGDVLNVPPEELKKRWPKRYEIYIKSLRDMKAEKPLGPEMKNWLSILNSLDAYLKPPESEEKGILREKQLHVFSVLRDFLEKNPLYMESGELFGQKGYIKLPTGVGKTILFLEFLKAIHTKSAGKKSMIIVPTGLLIDKTIKEIQEKQIPLQFGVVSGEMKQFDKPLTITTYASFRINVENGKFKPEEYDCLILDEAHESQGLQTTDALKNFPNTLILGFTATPDYSEEKQLRNILPTEIYSMPVKEAIEEGLLCDCVNIIVKTKVDLDQVRAAGDFNLEELGKAVNIKARNEAAVKLYKERFSGQKAVVFCTTINHAEEVSGLFSQNSIPTKIISGKTPKREKEQILKDFAAGEIKVLCNADILTRGFDDKPVSICINLRPTLSAVMAEQRAGRVLRLDEDNPDKMAYVVDFLDKTKEGKRQPIIYADVLGGAAVGKAVSAGQPGQGTKKKISAEKPTIDLGPDFELVWDETEVMKVMREKQERGVILPPPDWLSESEMLVQIHGLPVMGIGGLHDLKRIFYRKHPDWFGTFSDRRNHKKKRPYISPEIYKKIRADFKNITWKPVDELTAKNNIDFDIFNSIFKANFSFSTEDYVPGKLINGNCSPAFRKEIDKLIEQKRPEILEKMKIEEEKRLDRAKIQAAREAEERRVKEEMEEVARKQEEERVWAQAEVRRLKREGWISINEAMESAQQYYPRDARDELKRELWSDPETKVIGGEAFIHPETVTRIIAKRKAETAEALKKERPVGWFTKTEIIQKVQAFLSFKKRDIDATGEVSGLIEEQRKPDWFKEGQFEKYYSSDLLKAVMQKVTKKYS